MYKTLLIILAVLIILVPFSGVPGGVEDVLMQIFAAVVLVLVLLLPKQNRAESVEKEEHDYSA